MITENVSATVGKSEQTDMRAKYKKRSQIAQIWNRFKKNKLALFGLAIFVLMVIAAVSAPLYLDYEKDVVEQNIMMRFQGMSAEHPFGTDAFGRDILNRVIWGARVSMFVGFVVVAVALSIGIVIGSLSGFIGGKLDNILMRIVDVIMAIPQTLLAIAIVSSFGNSIRNLILAMSIGLIPSMSRIIRSSVMGLKGQEFIEAAKAYGSSGVRIILRHIIPNAIGPITVQGTLTVARSIITIASLSFIGLGIQPPNPEWGAMLSDAKSYMIGYPYLVYAPGIAIILTVMSLTLIGDGLRDAIDPKLKR